MSWQEQLYRHLIKERQPWRQREDDAPKQTPLNKLCRICFGSVFWALVLLLFARGVCWLYPVAAARTCAAGSCCWWSTQAAPSCLGQHHGVSSSVAQPAARSRGRRRRRGRWTKRGWRPVTSRSSQQRHLASERIIVLWYMHQNDLDLERPLK